MNVTELPTLYTEQQLAGQLGVHPETLARERRSGKLSYTRIGRKIRYTAAHVAAYLEAMQCATTSKPAAGSGTSAGPMLDGLKANRRALEIAELQKGS